MNLRTTFAIAALTGALLAQNQFVAPNTYATTEGNSALTFLFTAAPVHIQQVHGDLGSTPRAMTALSFRRDGVSTAVTGLPRSIDLELMVGMARFANVGQTYAANYVGPAFQAIARRTVMSPDLTQAPPTPPAPFAFTLLFDAPYLFVATADFAWEMRVHSNSGTTSDPVRIDRAVAAFTNSPGALLGPSCRSTGATQNYNLLGTMGTNANPEFRWSIQGFPTPPSCPLNVLLVGVSDPNLAVPGLCTNVRSSGELQLAMPASDVNGTWTYPLLFLPYNPAWVGFTFYEQAFSADPGQPGIPIVATAGMRLTFQVAPSGLAAMVKTLNDTRSATGPVAQSISDGGFVVQITH